jgi:hypothetical protein
MKKKLVLNKETLRRLSNSNLKAVLGRNTGPTWCYDCGFYSDGYTCPTLPECLGPMD